VCVCVESAAVKLNTFCHTHATTT